MELRVGGKYKFSKKLGEGGFGALYSGYNVKTNEDVAIKLVSNSSQCDGEVPPEEEDILFVLNLESWLMNEWI